MKIRRHLKTSVFAYRGSSKPLKANQNHVSMQKSFKVKNCSVPDSVTNDCTSYNLNIQGEFIADKREKLESFSLNTTLEDSD